MAHEKKWSTQPWLCLLSWLRKALGKHCLRSDLRCLTSRGWDVKNRTTLSCCFNGFVACALQFLQFLQSLQFWMCHKKVKHVHAQEDFVVKPQPNVCIILWSDQFDSIPCHQFSLHIVTYTAIAAANATTPVSCVKQIHRSPDDVFLKIDQELCIHPLFELDISVGCWE